MRDNTRTHAHTHTQQAGDFFYTHSESSGIAHSSLKKHHQVRGARVRRHTVFDNFAPLAEHAADILVPPFPQTPARCGFFRGHLLVICAAKPRHTAAAAREHRRVLAPRLPTPGQVSRPRCARHERCSLRCASAAPAASHIIYVPYPYAQLALVVACLPRPRPPR